MSGQPPLRVAIFKSSLPVPSASPACLKLLTWLRMAGIPYETEAPAVRPASKTGKVPYLIRPDGSLLDDSQAIIDAVSAERGVELDSWMDEATRARALAIRRLVEDHLYFSVLHRRWLDEGEWPRTRAAYFAQLPAPLRAIVPGMVRRNVRAAAWGQGLARRTAEVIDAEGAADVVALGHLLGSQEWFLGRPSSLDASVYGTLANIDVMSPFPAVDTLKADSRLHGWLERMRRRWWADGSAA